MPYQVEYIAAALKKARKAKKLSQTELGAKVGLPQSHVSKIETGRKTTAARTISFVLGTMVIISSNLLVCEN